jgi:signal transduction histidine kinase
MQVQDRAGAPPGAAEPVVPSAAALEKMKRQWELAADALSQVVLLLDKNARVIRANRTLERWGLAPVAQVRGLTLHEALHGPQCNGRCAMQPLWHRLAERLQRGQAVKHEAWDAQLGRHVSIVIEPQARTSAGEVGAVVTIEDVGALQEQLSQITAQHVTVREDERRRLARDLHDSLGQSLNLLKLSIQETACRFERDAEPAAEPLHRLAREVQHIMGEVRRIAMALRPSTLDDLGLIPTLNWFFREFELGCRQLKIERAVEVSDADVPEPLKIAIYRILQEAICNTVRHAQATKVSVRLHRDSHGLHFSIEDDGRGFDGDAGRGIGLVSMRERTETSGGHLVVASVPGKGTRVTACWPASAHRRAAEPGLRRAPLRAALRKDGALAEGVVVQRDA